MPQPGQGGGTESVPSPTSGQRWRIGKGEGDVEPDAKILTETTNSSRPVGWKLSSRRRRHHHHLHYFMRYHVLDFSFLFLPPSSGPNKAALNDGHPENAAEGSPVAAPRRTEPGRAEPSRDSRGPAAQLPGTLRPGFPPRRESRRYLSCRFSSCRTSSPFPPGTEPACHSPPAHTLPPWGW